MPKKVIDINHDELNIRVENTWFNGARLYINGSLKDKNGQLFSTSDSRTFLEHTLVLDGKEYQIEVFCVAWLFVKLKICVNGVFAGGHNF